MSPPSKPNTPAPNPTADFNNHQTLAYRYEDEISLVDLWLVLVRRKLTIFTVAAPLLTAGLLYALLSAPTYLYSTVIETGTVVNDNGMITPVESPSALLTKVKRAYIPQVLHNANNKGDEQRYDLSASIPKESGLIVLEAKGAVSERDTYIALLTDITRLAARDHREIQNVTRGHLDRELADENITLASLLDEAALNVEKSKLKNELKSARLTLAEMQDPNNQRLPIDALKIDKENAKLTLSSLKDQYTLIEAKIDRGRETAQLIKKQTTDLQEQIKRALQHRQRSTTEATDEARAMTLLLISNEIQQNRNHLADLEERLYVELEDKKETLQKSLANNTRKQAIQQKNIALIERRIQKAAADNRRLAERQQPAIDEIESELTKLSADQKHQIARQRQVIKELENRVANIRETRAVTPPMQSLQPVGPSNVLIVALALIVGLLLGVFAAFMQEFLSKANQQTRRTLPTQ